MGCYFLSCVLSLAYIVALTIKNCAHASQNLNDMFMSQKRLTAYICRNNAHSTEKAYILHPLKDATFDEQLWSLLSITTSQKCGLRQNQKATNVLKKTGYPTKNWCTSFRESVTTIAMFNHTVYQCENGKFKLKGCFLLSNESRSYVISEPDVTRLLLKKSNTNVNNQLCKDYFDKAKKSQNYYSYFHGFPFVLVPGYFSSFLFAKKNQIGSEVSSDIEEEIIWPSQDVLNSTTFKQWVDTVKLNYDPVTGKTSDQKNVSIYSRPLTWGDSKNVLLVENVTEPYFYKIVQRAVEYGYTKGKSIVAAPYDFRKSPDELKDYFQQLKNLIQKTYYMNNKRKVIIIAHSLGGVNMHYFLNRIKTEWKSKFIHSFVPIASPLNGAIRAVDAILRGDATTYNHMIERRTFRDVQQTFPSNFLMLPKTGKWDSDMFVSTRIKNYTTSDYKRLFQRIRCDNCWKIYSNTKNIMASLQAPEVQVHCLYATGIDTPVTYNYDGLFPKNVSSIIHTKEGDGLVSVKSANECYEWRKFQRSKVVRKVFNGTHSGIMQQEIFLKELMDILFNKTV